MKDKNSSNNDELSVRERMKLDKEIEEYLDCVEKNLYVFVSTYTENGKYNQHKERMESMSTGLENHFERLKSGNIIDNYEICPRSFFDDFLENEILS